MSASDDTPGEFPKVHDEAPDTPTWVPLLGLGLLTLFALFAVYRAATAEEEPAADVDIVIGAEVPAPEAAAAPAPAQPAPTPAVPPGGSQRPGHEGHDHP